VGAPVVAAVTWSNPVASAAAAPVTDEIKDMGSLQE
jgi:hypothetical protein